jgi:O-antigen/teichoic acid export membrane protein
MHRITQLKTFLFINSSARQTIAKNTLWLLIGDIGYKCVQALLIFWLAYTVGKEEFGLYSYITSVTWTILLLVDYNLIQTSIRSVNQWFLSTQTTIQHSIFLKILLSTLSLCILLCISFFSAQPLSFLLLLFASYGYLLLINIAAYLRSTYRHEEMMEKEALLKILSWVILLIVWWISLFFGGDLTSFIYWLCIVWIIDLLATCMYLPSSVFSHFFQNVTLNTALSLAKYWLPIAMSNFLVSMYINADQIILWWYGQHEGLGIYSFAYKITLFFTLFSSAFFNALFPKTTLHVTHENSVPVFLNWLQLIAKRNSIIILILIGITYLLQQSNLAIFGEYTAALGVLLILWLYCLTEPIGYWWYTILVSIKKDSLNTVFLAVTAAINILGNIIFIPLYGYIAAARITVFSYLVYSVLCFFAITVCKKNK